MSTDIDSGEYTPLPVEAVRDLAPVTALLGWVLVLLAIARIPTYLLVAGFYGLSFMVTAIVITYVSYWAGLFDF